MNFLSNFTKICYEHILDFTWPAFDFYYQIRPIIMLPFNIWFFFVSLPFRVSLFFFNGLMYKTLPSRKTLELKEATIYRDPVFEVKDQKTIIEVEVKAMPSITVTSPQIRQRKVVAAQDSPFSWYTARAVAKVEKVESVQSATQTESIPFESVQSKSIPSESAQPESIIDEFKSQLEAIAHKKEEVMPKVSPVEFSDLKERINYLERHEAAAAEEKQRLESQLKDLTDKFNADEQALASFEADRARYKEMIAAQQTKSFDLQQDIIALKNKVKFEEESLIKAQEELSSIRKARSELKQALIESAEIDESPVVSFLAKEIESEPVVESEARAELKHALIESAEIDESPVVSFLAKEIIESEHAVESEPIVESKPVEAAKPAWSVQHHENDYTQMVAEAQRKEHEHTSFADVVKASIEEPVVDAQPVEEFTVVGGDLSSKHIKEVVSESEPVVESEPVAESKPVEEHKAWNIPHHETDYTEMVAEAQRKEHEHTSFADVVKASLETEVEEALAAETDAVEEFTVVGGDLSTKHIVLANGDAPSIAITN